MATSTHARTEAAFCSARRTCPSVPSTAARAATRQVDVEPPTSVAPAQKEPWLAGMKSIKCIRHVGLAPIATAGLKAHLQPGWVTTADASVEPLKRTRVPFLGCHGNGQQKRLAAFCSARITCPSVPSAAARTATRQVDVAQVVMETASGGSQSTRHAPAPGTCQESREHRQSLVRRGVAQDSRVRITCPRRRGRSTFAAPKESECRRSSGHRASMPTSSRDRRQCFGPAEHPPQAEGPKLSCTTKRHQHESMQRRNLTFGDSFAARKAPAGQWRRFFLRCRLRRLLYLHRMRTWLFPGSPAAFVRLLRQPRNVLAQRWFSLNCGSSPPAQDSCASGLKFMAKHEETLKCRVFFSSDAFRTSRSIALRVFGCSALPTTWLAPRGAGTGNKHLKAEVSKLQEKVCSLINEIAETRDSEALKLERLYREAKEENRFMRRAVTAASAGVTPGFNCCSTGKQTCACCTTRCTQVHADTGRPFHIVVSAHSTQA
ncbi:hypothetical protein V5799_007516 [Amblyomma americanum]|uniref:Uncharacterized protein n=1 Tax=Amblyomma americanum TaxID=6943 RepID=A0AAQ4FH63_AMBAM